MNKAIANLKKENSKLNMSIKKKNNDFQIKLKTEIKETQELTEKKTFKSGNLNLQNLVENIAKENDTRLMNENTKV